MIEKTNNTSLGLFNLLKLAQNEECEKLVNIFKSQSNEIKSIIYYFIRKQNGVITDEENNKYNEYLQKSFFTEKDIIKQWNTYTSFDTETNPPIRNYITKKLTETSIDNWFGLLPATIQLLLLLLIAALISQNND